jgi:hypothetical protein
MPDGPVRTDQAYVESHESEYITPADAVRSKAMAEVYQVADSLKFTGITEQQFQNAAKHRADAAQLEFETNEKADPIRRLIDVLQNSAVSGRDQEIIAEQVKYLEKQRAGWKDLVGRERTRARMQGNEARFSVDGAVKDAIQTNSAPTFSTMEDREPVVCFEVLDSTWLKTEKADGIVTDERVRPSDECLNKVLKGLGVLQPNEKAGDLRMLPSSQNTPEGKPRYYSGSDAAKSMPTSMPDVTATLFFKDNRVMAGVGVKALEKIVAFPASV